MNSKTTIRRVLALALCVLFAAASAHTAGHTHARNIDDAGHPCHDSHGSHDDGACPVCAHLKSLSSTTVDTPRAFVFAFTNTCVPEFAVCLVDNDTLVRLKVRLNR